MFDTAVEAAVAYAKHEHSRLTSTSSMWPSSDLSLDETGLTRTHKRVKSNFSRPVPSTPRHRGYFCSLTSDTCTATFGTTTITSSGNQDAFVDACHKRGGRRLSGVKAGGSSSND